MDLVIIEGAGKVKKISSILKDLNMNAKVIATCGHIERLKDDQYDGTGIDKELNYHFEWIDGKSKILKEINDLAKNANNIYIASDPDREGEGIAWHVFNKLIADNKKKAKRITFNEISKSAINDAIKNPRLIDMNYVNAYLARIALDKKVGYGLSKYLQQTNNLPSAGRVQSVVLKLINERENEIINFVPKTSYSFCPKIGETQLKQIKTYNDLGLYTNHLNKPFSFNNEIEAINYKNNFLSKNEWKLFHIGEKQIKKSYPPKPFKTSTIQAELIKELKINSKQVEKILQELYQQGLITYPRTDATRISEQFCDEAYKYVKHHYSNLANNEFKFNKSGSGTQDAHEAIRVVHLENNGIDLDGMHKTAYKIIYENTIIQFMNPCIKEVTEFFFINNKDEFSTNAEIIIDQGFNEYLNKIKNDKIVNFTLNQIYQIDNYDDLIKSSITTPPSPFNQSSLIKELENLGIGRPSTYASSVEINNQRNYTTIDENEVLSTTNIGKQANDSLCETWNELINYTFTAEMEKSLDKIAENQLDYKQYLKSFLNEFEQKLYSFINLKNINNQSTKELNVVGQCPKCGSNVVSKTTNDGKVFEECIKRKYDFKTKKISGCKYIKWNS